MRKLLFAAIFVAGFSITAFATTDNPVGISLLQEKQYKKIEVSTVSKEVLAKIKKSYGNYTIKEAHKADDGEYKLILTKDGIDTTVTLTPAGEIIKIY
jgi:hypothetical protein